MTFRPYSEEKVWGRVMHVFASPHAAVSCLEVKAGFRCSCHRHAHRANLFAVQEGALAIDEWKQETLLVPSEPHVSTILNPGDTYVVPSGVWHRFRVLVSGRVTEVYWVDKGREVSIHDIERIDEGGPDVP